MVLVIVLIGNCNCIGIGNCTGNCNCIGIGIVLLNCTAERYLLWSLIEFIVSFFIFNQENLYMMHHASDLSYEVCDAN